MDAYEYINHTGTRYQVIYKIYGTYEVTCDTWILQEDKCLVYANSYEAPGSIYLIRNEVTKKVANHSTYRL